MSLRLGDQVADYQVIGMLGTGGMGAVYQVRHLISDRVEAMKVLLPDLASNPELAERFIREIRLQASLTHPNIAALHNALRFENQLLMVMEFVDGETLAEVIRRGTLHVRHALRITIQILAALDYAHSRGVIHRDVKPSNVIINAQGTAKLMDFGIARGISAYGELTQAGAAVGSMYYMPPEQVRGEKLDGRSDLYAMGVTLFEALTGERPIKGRTAAEVLQAQLTDSAPDPSLLNSAVTPELSRAVMKALEKNAADRYQTAAEFSNAVAAVLNELPVNSSDAAPLFPPRPKFESGASAETLFGEFRRVADPTPQRTSSNPVSFDPLGLERVRKELAQHIGPMAKLLVDRAAKRARTWQEVYAQLAPEVPAGKERERFLASCPRT